MAAAKKRAPARKSAKTSVRKAPRKSRGTSGGLDSLVAHETALLQERCAEINAELKTLNAELGRINTRLQGLKFAKAALEGKAVAAPARGQKAAGGGSGVGNGKSPGRQRRGAVSEQVLAAIAGGEATSRSALIATFGFENDKAGQVSISNALTQLNKKGLIKSGKARGEWVAK